MKKAILLALAALAFPAFGGSIDWALNTAAAANYMVGKDGEKLTGVAYLMLTDSIKDFASEQEIIDTSLDSLAISGGINKTVTTTTNDRITPVDGSTAISFTVLVFDSASKSFYTSAAREQTAYNLTGDELTDAKQVSFTAANLYASAATRGSQTWTSVPEPSTAALALAGLALLLKRRKA